MELPIILALAFGAMWLMTNRTRKQQKKAAEFRNNLAPGQEVMTGSGMFATIVAVEDEIVTLETAPGVTSRWLRPAIAKLVEPPVVDDELDDEVDEVDEDAEYDGEEYEDELEYGDDEVIEEDEVLDDEPALGTSTTTRSGLLEDGSAPVEIPDDASRLTTDPDDGSTPRR